MTEVLADREMTGLNEAALVAWGEAVGRRAVAAPGGDAPSGALPLVLALRGELGAGKSVLARAVARGAGVTSPMPSPTFNLVFQYRAGSVDVYHVDLYRLEDPADVWELGWRELGEGSQVVLIEWPERAESLLPVPRWDVRIAPSARGAEWRDLRCTPVGAALPLASPGTG